MNQYQSHFMFQNEFSGNRQSQLLHAKPDRGRRLMGSVVQYNNSA